MRALIRNPGPLAVMVTISLPIGLLLGWRVALHWMIGSIIGSLLSSFLTPPKDR